LLDKEEEAALRLAEAIVKDVSLAANVERDASLPWLLVICDRVLASNAVFVGPNVRERAGREEL